MMNKGTVKWFNPTKGYGFVQQDGKGDVFVHYNSIIANGYKVLNKGDQVQYEVEKGPKGFQAKDVKKIL